AVGDRYNGHGEITDEFFSRSRVTDEMAALAEQEASTEREKSNARFFIKICLGVGAVMAGVGLAIYLATPVGTVPAAEEEPAEATGPAIPNVVIPELGAQVKSGEEALRDVVRQAGQAQEAPAPPQRSA